MDSPGLGQGIKSRRSIRLEGQTQLENRFEIGHKYVRDVFLTYFAYYMAPPALLFLLLVLSLGRFLGCEMTGSNLQTPTHRDLAVASDTCDRPVFGTAP